ncbi:hypothetical protein BT96DRAFT_921725 [Gymnopus androsaceus JB14]|uniref:Uncharacterized protein n=1 Tax=Gymnopus androsaceus JB14 TaxID=1447944 RepID=A0A6A4HF80_9AGAR|nr:hypothetical protein BT96DRAFT_921725 [Gymnopus androsaceus JB14]
MLPPITTLVEPSSAEASESPESITLDVQQKADDTSLLESPSLVHSLGMLEALFEFYHHERRWILQQREAVLDDPDLSSGSESGEENVPSSSTLPYKDEVIKSEPPSFSLPCIAESSKSRLSSSTLRFSRWPWSSARSFERGLGEPRLIAPPAGQRLQENSVVKFGEAPGSVPILDMFENMMEARLESCQRIDKLIRRAHRKADDDYGAVSRSAGRRMTRD